MTAHEFLDAAVREIVREEIAAALEALAGLAEVTGNGDRWPAYFSVPDAAAYSGVPEKRIRNLLAAGTLARVQEGPRCRVLVSRADLDALLASWRTEARS